MKIYDEGSEPLHELIATASSGDGATLLIPDLQRPYVWDPYQVIRLVDSLLRGWPFGTLLLWKVSHEELAGIPQRPFWRIVDRTGDFDDAQVGKGNPPNQFRMVLDGQQRMQSLLLTFAGDAWGFRLLDQEWSDALDAERPRGRNAKRHWSFGHLCLDTRAFHAAVGPTGSSTNVDYSTVLNWVVHSPSEGRSKLRRPPNYKFPIPSALDDENKGRYIQLSRLWKAAEIGANLREAQYRAILVPLLKNHGVPESIAASILSPLAELLYTLKEVKLSKVSYLQLDAFNPAVTNREVYNDAIVNIFTRLNSAGRALTKQEITFAWIKMGWDPSLVENKRAIECFEDLQKALAGEGASLDMDGVVACISTMWSVMHNSGALLTDADLLKGEKVKPMAQNLVGYWGTLETNATEGVHLLNERGLKLGTHYRSLNVLILLLTWRLLGRQWIAGASLNATQRDSFEKSLDGTFNAHCDRWILFSQWSGRWGKGTDKAMADYAAELAADWATILAEASPDTVLAVLQLRLQSWLAALQGDATKTIDALAVPDRNRVHEYYLPLWLWHRLDENRWQASGVALRESKRGTPSLHVDHVVAFALWPSLPGGEALDVANDDDTVDMPDANGLADARNALGNCLLLESSFNISKGQQPLADFLNRVHEFTTGSFVVATWTGNIGLDPNLVDPIGKSAEDVAKAVEARTTAMKSELREYIQGTRERKDL
jgi:hypothetical protein